MEKKKRLDMPDLVRSTSHGTSHIIIWLVLRLSVDYHQTPVNVMGTKGIYRAGTEANTKKSETERGPERSCRINTQGS